MNPGMIKKLKKMQDVVMFLQNYNISTNLAMKIFNRYGDDARNVVQKNPYKLVREKISTIKHTVHHTNLNRINSQIKSNNQNPVFKYKLVQKVL